MAVVETSETVWLLHVCLSHANVNSRYLSGFFKKKGQSLPLFVYVHLFRITKFYKLMKA